MCSIHIVYIKNSKVIVCHAEHSLGFKFTTLPCEQLLQTHKSVTFDFIRENDLVQSEATRQASSTPYRLMSTCDWVFPKQTSTPSNSYEDHYEDQREREKTKRAIKSEERTCVCVYNSDSHRHHWELMEKKRCRHLSQNNMQSWQPWWLLLSLPRAFVQAH